MNKGRKQRLTTDDDNYDRTALRAYVADWMDTRAGKNEILARLSPEERRKLGQAQLDMVGKPKLEPSGAGRFFDAIEAGQTIEQARETAGSDNETAQLLKDEPAFGLAMDLASEARHRTEG